MAKLNRKSNRLLLIMMAAMMATMAMVSTAYGLHDLKSADNEFSGETEFETQKNETVWVQKMWNSGEDHPSSVEVQLYRDGDAYGGTATLNDDNWWSYTWTGLDSSFHWTVDEPDVPKGYVKEVTGNEKQGYVITNTFVQEEEVPEAPDLPEPPTGIPSDPSDLLGIQDQWAPSSDAYPGVDENGVREGGNIPKTGDGTDPRPWLIILAACTVALRRVLFFRAKHML